MEAITLRPDLRESLEREAQRLALSLDDLANEAIENYMRQLQRAKIDDEIGAFHAKHQELKRQYLGQWVAFHEKRLVDHDIDRATLYRRIRKAYGDIAVLIRQVEDEPDREIWFRTISTGKIER